jgi:hypothetical protein
MLPGYMKGIENAGAIPVMLPLTSDIDVIQTFATVASVSLYRSYILGSSNMWLSYILLTIAGGCLNLWAPIMAMVPDLLPKKHGWCRHGFC